MMILAGLVMLAVGCVSALDFRGWFSRHATRHLGRMPFVRGRPRLIRRLIVVNRISNGIVGVVWCAVLVAYGVANMRD